MLPPGTAGTRTPPGGSAGAPQSCSQGRNLGSLVPQLWGQSGRLQAGWVPGRCRSTQGSSRSSHAQLGPEQRESPARCHRAQRGGLQWRGCDFIWAERAVRPHHQGLSQRHRQATGIAHKICLQPPRHGFTRKKTNQNKTKTLCKCSLPQNAAVEKPAPAPLVEPRNTNPWGCQPAQQPRRVPAARQAGLGETHCSP